MGNNITHLRIALLASHGFHQGPDSPMVRFVREFEQLLMNHQIFITEGLWGDISGCGLLIGHKNLNLLRPKRDGGIVEATDMVVDRKLDVVIFLINPTDIASVFPECSALKRECVAKEKYFLSTYASACEWATLTWSTPSPYVLTDRESEELQKLRKIKITTSLSNQTIALIAHNKMKIKMLRFAKNHSSLFNNFKKIIGTGTTARLLQGEKKAGELDALLEGRSQDEKRDIQKAIDEVRRLKLRLNKVQRMHSGPDGGDVQIARRVMDGKCDKVVFFEDPFTARPHEPDIQLLERTCQTCGESVICFSDPVSADKWAKAWKRLGGNYRAAAPATLARALEKYLSSLAKHPVYVIITPTDQDEKKIVRNICLAAAQYLNALILKSGPDKDKTGEELRLVVPWGTIMGEDLIKELKKIATSKEKSRKVPNLITLPMTGLMHAENPSVEAARLAEEIKEFFGGRHYSIPISTFVSIDATLGHHIEEVLQHFKKADIVLLHGKPIIYPGSHFGTENRAPVDPEMVEDVYKKGAICEISGLFLNKKGMEVHPSKYQRVGMNYHMLQNAGNNTECHSILLIGTPDKSVNKFINMTKAIFLAQFPSILITDVAFARHLLGLEIDTEVKAANHVQLSGTH